MKTRKQISSIASFVFFVCFFCKFSYGYCIATTNINTNSSQATAGTPAAGATSVLLYYFTCNVTVAAPSFTGITNFTTSGSYIAGDLINIKLWRSDFEFFGGGTLVVVQTLVAGLGPGTHSFAFANQLPGAGSKFFWITADFAANAMCGDAITCDLLTVGMYNITGMKNYGTNDLAGAQTVTGGGCQPMPVDLLSFNGNATGAENSLYWSTATETNNSFFTLEKSLNGKSYKEIRRIK